MHFVAALRFTVQNSFFDIGPTRRPSESRSSDTPSAIDWVLTRNFDCHFCELQWPGDWEGAKRIRSDHAIICAGTHGQVRPPRNANSTRKSPCSKLRGWTPPINCVANALDKEGILKPHAWTWHSAWDQSFPSEAIIQEYNVTPQPEDLNDSIDSVRKVALQMRLDSEKSFENHVQLLEVLSPLCTNSSYRSPAVCVRHLFPHINFASDESRNIHQVVKLLRAAKRSLNSDQLNIRQLRTFIIRMESFAFRAFRRRRLATSTSFDDFMKNFRTHSRKPRPVQLRYDDQDNPVQPCEAPRLIFEYYAALYGETQSDYQSPFDLDIEPGIKRADLLMLGAAANSTRLRGGLPPGPDGLTAEVLRSLSNSQLSEMCALATTAFVERPTSWTNMPVRLLPKGSAIALYSNRLVAFQASSHKLYLAALTKVVLSEICDFLDVHLGGVKPGDYAPAWIARASVAIAKAKEWNIPMCIASLDTSRAFATINHQYLLTACHRLGVRDTWICLISRELTLQNIDLIYDGVSLGRIHLERGVVEGIPISSLLLAIYSTYFWQHVRSHPVYLEHCMTFPAYRDSTAFRFNAAGWVDDWLVASSTTDGLSQIFCLISNMFRHLGMKIALDKTQWLHVGMRAPPAALYLDGHPLQSSGSILYLGALLSASGVLEHIDYRSRKMLAIWGRLQRSMKTSGASYAMLMKAANTVALPSLLWSIQAFPITTNVILKIQTTYMTILRSIFGSRSRSFGENWILMHSFIKNKFRLGILVSPAMEIYRQQEKLHMFLQANQSFDLNYLMKWRSVSWLSNLSRVNRPSRPISGSPPRQLEQEFLERTEYSTNFRALKYAERHSALPFG